jgi:hypothetical protein
MDFYVVSASPCGPKNDRPDWRTARILSGHHGREEAERMAWGMNRASLFGRVYVVCAPHELRGYPRRQALPEHPELNAIVIEMGWDFDPGTRR